MPAISSIETRRETIAFSAASFSAPTAMVTDSTAGSATGIEATVRISANWIVSRIGSCRKSEASPITRTSPIVIRMRKLPMRSTARWKWETDFACSTRRAVLPKYVFMPVAVTTPVISPCLAMEPE